MYLITRRSDKSRQELLPIRRCPVCFSPCLPLPKPSAPTPCTGFTPRKIFMLHAQIHQLLLNDKLADATAYLREDIKETYHHFEDATVARA